MVSASYLTAAHHLASYHAVVLFTMLFYYHSLHHFTYAIFTSLCYFNIHSIISHMLFSIHYAILIFTPSFQERVFSTI